MSDRCDWIVIAGNRVRRCARLAGVHVGVRHVCAWHRRTAARYGRAFTMASLAHLLAVVPSFDASFSTRAFSSCDSFTPSVTRALSGDGFGPGFAGFLDTGKG